MAVHGSGRQSLTHGGNQQPQAFSPHHHLRFLPGYYRSLLPSSDVFSAIVSDLFYHPQSFSPRFAGKKLSLIDSVAASGIAAALIVTPTNPATALRLYTTVSHRLFCDVIIATNIAFGPTVQEPSLIMVPHDH
ncbi:uncharacterized protein LOC130962538 [Arachis stenosperma]|uniref:uncharacterized protein LOC130962538 n=1 Tax=Arachis stenosperma TaxID=217475 RepID=UPI0025ACFA23|nr:uncharacterized protein LOC130962538 [Arachis stenosperma]